MCNNLSFLKFLDPIPRWGVWGGRWMGSMITCPPEDEMLQARDAGGVCGGGRVSDHTPS